MILKSARVEDYTYVDLKPVREAFSTAYLAVLEAINEYLTKRGVTKKELPRSVDAYRKALQKHIAIPNGKLMREFEKLYDALHIAGYYRGLIYDVDMVKDALNAAKVFIDKIIGALFTNCGGNQKKIKNWGNGILEKWNNGFIKTLEDWNCGVKYLNNGFCSYQYFVISVLQIFSLIFQYSIIPIVLRFLLDSPALGARAARVLGKWNNALM